MPTLRIAGALVLVGGPTLKISVNGKLIAFEDHSYCGPTMLNRHGDPLKNQTPEFLTATTLWAQQGRRVQDGLCQWDHEKEPILKRINSRNAIVIGWHPARKGE